MASIFSPASLQGAQGIERFPAKSSFIAAFEYDQSNLTLSTWLMNGSMYQHKFFLPSEWENLKTSQNHSKHWADKIKGKHASVRVITKKSPKSELRRKGK